MGIPSAVKGPIMSQSLTFITSATLNKCSNRVHGCGVSICAPRAERRRYREMEIAQRYPGRAWCPRRKGPRVVPRGSKRGFVMRRRSPATAIALVALFFSVSGTAYAATGGDFLLGKSNTANTVTSLSNKKGTALSLSSNSSAPSLSVSNSVEVPNLNASELDGSTSSAFSPPPALPQTRANSGVCPLAATCKAAVRQQGIG